MATKTSNEPAEVEVNINYSLTLYLPIDDAVALNKLLLKATFVNFSDYEDGYYNNHSIAFPNIQLTPRAQPIKTSIEEAAIVEMPLHQYLKDKGLSD